MKLLTDIGLIAGKTVASTVMNGYDGFFYATDIIFTDDTCIRISMCDYHGEPSMYVDSESDISLADKAKLGLAESTWQDWRGGKTS